MRELLLDKGDTDSIEIPQNVTGKNDYLTNILPSMTHKSISIELSPNSNFNSDLLVKLNPSFVSITWLGNDHLEISTQKLPAVILAEKLLISGFPVLMHLAGRNTTKERMLDILEYLKDIGVKNILALQGDRSTILETDDSKCDFPYASDLVKFIKDTFKDAFCVGVAGYPDGHPTSRTKADDIKYLKEKVSNGAEFIITQATFEFDTLRRFATSCRRNDINVPILPGIFIIKSYEGLVKTAKLCDFTVSENVLKFLERNKQFCELIKVYGVDYAFDMVDKCSQYRGLFKSPHVFSMNDLETVAEFRSKCLYAKHR